MFCRILCCFVAKSLFYAIYAVLSRNLFCRYLRALAWRKIGPKILSVEKKGQMWGMRLQPVALQTFQFLSGKKVSWTLEANLLCCKRLQVYFFIKISKSQLCDYRDAFPTNNKGYVPGSGVNWFKTMFR